MFTAYSFVVPFQMGQHCQKLKHFCWMECSDRNNSYAHYKLQRATENTPSTLEACNSEMECYTISHEELSKIQLQISKANMHPSTMFILRYRIHCP